MSLDPRQVVASFDSASVLHAALVAALRGQTFPHLGNPPIYGRLVRIGGRLPWPLLKQIYARIGGAEGIDPKRLAEVDLDAVAASFAEAYPRRRYPAVVVGSSNGALTHLAAAMQVPWLPQTVLVPVHRIGDPERADQALEFGRRWGPELLGPNPGVRLHQMHDSAQDELMTARMTYFRTKWTALPPAYERFLARRLAPGAPVLIADDAQSWPVTTVGERHTFQTGGLGGLSPEQHLARPDAPPADAEAPEAEWGADPGFVAAVRRWCAEHGHPAIHLRYDGPQQVAAPVADTWRRWLRARDEPGDRLLVPSFVLGDPWTTLNTALVPYWTYFPVQPALRALDDHLSRARSEGEPYREVDVLAFQHGAMSPGVALPDDFAAAIRRHGAEPRLLAVDPGKAPHDIGSLGRYGPVLAGLPRARIPWSPLAVPEALAGLAELVVG